MPTFIYSSIILVLISSFGFAQDIQRKLLVEEFSNASCPPCFTYNPGFDAILKHNAEKVVPIKYQVWWPGFDPFYNLNPTEIDARIIYYGITSIPQYTINGGPRDNVSNLSHIGLTQEYTGNLTPFSIQMSHSLNQHLDSIRIDIHIKNVGLDTVVGSHANSMKLYVALVEEELKFSESVGRNGETEFDWIMRKMFPDNSGTFLEQIWHPGEEHSFVLEEAIPDFIYDYHQLATVAFIQDDQTQYVYQAEKTTPDSLTSGVADTQIEVLNQTEKELCDTVFRPEILVINHGPETLTSFDVLIRMNGDSSAQKSSWVGNLAASDTTTILLDPFKITNKTHLSYEIANMSNGILEASRINDGATSTLTGVDYQAVSFSQDFENLKLFPNYFLDFDGIVEAPDLAFPNVTDSLFSTFSDHKMPLGGFGNSASALVMHLGFIWEETTLGFRTDVFDMTQSVGGTLKFAQADAPGDSGEHTLLISASVDCGDTWTEVIQISGDDLHTGHENSHPFIFFPEPNEWTTHSIDLRDFAGQEVMFQFEASGTPGGMSMYIDDFEIISQAVSIEDSHLEEAINIFPNPFASTTKLAINLDQQEDLDIQVLDVMGRQVLDRTHSHLGGLSTLEIDGYTWTPGIYRVVISSSRDQIVRNLVLSGN